MQKFTFLFLSLLALFFSIQISAHSIEKNPDSSQMMDSDLIITEIMYNPSGSDTDWEWIEIYNKGVEPIDLSGYVLDDNGGAQLSAANITSGILPAGKSAILFDVDDVTAEQFQDVWGNVNLIAVTNWSALGNSAGDSIAIWDTYGSYDDDNQSQTNAIEKVIYKNNEEGWPNDNNSGSIYLIALDADNSIGSNWALSINGAETPLNAAYTSMGLHENSGNDVGSPGTGEFEDTTPPEIECPETVEINHDEGLCSSEIPLLEPSATDNVSTELVVEGIRSDGLDLFEPFPVGNTIITWTVTDEAGNTSIPCDQVLTVIEIELPTAIGQNITVELDQNGLATINPQDLDNVETPSFDNCGIVAYFASRTEFDCTDLEAPVAVDFSVLDANNNTSTATNVLVTVVDNIKPELTCSSNINAISQNGSPLIVDGIIAPSVSDNCDSEPTITSIRSDEAELSAPFPVGMTTILWQVKDSSGNIAECSQIVTITAPEDSTPPTFDVDGNVEDFTTELEVGETYMVGNILNVVDESITVSQITGAELVDTTQSGGPFLVVYEVSDGNNTTTITETVLVTNPNPEITSFTLINADTNEDLFDILPDMQIDLNSLPTLNLDIRANASESTMSVRLNLTESLSISRTENVAPYALNGDFPQGNYYGTEFVPGPYTIRATAYSENQAQGFVSQPLELSFLIVHPCELFDVIIVDQFDTTSCGGADGFVLLYVEGTAPISYTWSHDSEYSQNLATDLTAGTYGVTVTDANNCTTEVIFEIKDPELPLVTLTPFDAVEVDTDSFTLTGGLPEGGIYSGEGVSEGTFDPSIGPGVYDITYTYIDEETNCENSVVQIIEVRQSELKVESFTLVNADTNDDILELTEGLQIDMNSLPTLNLNIRANTTDDVESVMLQISGALIASRKENVAPYAIFGDFPANEYFGKTFTAGSYSITAEPYSENQLGGELGSTLTINFELLDSDLAGRSANTASVYPNPAKEITTLQFENPAELLTIYLYDVLGRVVNTYEGRLVKKEGSYVLDIGSIPAGNYHIKTYDNQGNEYQKQLIIEK